MLLLAQTNVIHSGGAIKSPYLRMYTMITAEVTRDHSPLSYRNPGTYTGCNFPSEDTRFRRGNLGSSWTLSLHSQKSQGNT